MKHTKEPWKSHSLWYPERERDQVIWLESSQHSSICKMFSGNEQLDIVNASRIVDCINACAGMKPEEVPKMFEKLQKLAILLEAGKATTRNDSMQMANNIMLFLKNVKS